MAYILIFILGLKLDMPITFLYTTGICAVLKLIDAAYRTIHKDD
ncbi:hypothetical protein DFR55_10973 [Herbinix hemicellulosilytica]|uniref:Putative membrane protein n=1 Tax=Herbinix hemicellulosilytica TaxID=1564487 RepID=A0A0H5SIL1_HERHM|nr:hypothetical protein DFR55_10973 [Herbinix hemicellulosilytica]CRZ34935.1 putative membrane protein [Herbinix hemicellulosilytica]